MYLVLPPPIFEQNWNVDPADIKIHKENFLAELEMYRLLVEESQYWQKDPLFYSRLEFLFNLVEFHILALDSWALIRDRAKYNKTFTKAQGYLYYVQQLVDYMTNGHPTGPSYGWSSEE